MAPRKTKTGGKGTKSRSKASKSGRGKTSRRMSSSAPVMMPPALHSYSPSMDMDMDHGSGSEGWSLTLVFLGLLVLGGVVVAILWATGVFDKSETGGGNGTASPTSPPSSVPPGPAPAPPGSAPGPAPSDGGIGIGSLPSGKKLSPGGLVAVILAAIAGVFFVVWLMRWWLGAGGEDRKEDILAGGADFDQGGVRAGGWGASVRAGLGQAGSMVGGAGSSAVSALRGAGKKAARWVPGRGPSEPVADSDPTEGGMGRGGEAGA